MNEQFKDIVIGDRRYRIKKMDALPASRIHNWILSGASKLAQESKDNQAEPESKLTPEQKAEGLVVGVWIMASTLFSEELCEKTQIHCLQCCQQFPLESTEAPPTPVMMSDGRWVTQDLKTDSVTVNKLVLETLKFNISPFFLGSISNSALGV